MALALALGAATGNNAIARGVPAAVAIGGILLNGLGAVVAGFAPFRYLSPIYWFLGDSPPLLRGFSAGPLFLLAAALVAGGGKGCFWGCLGLADCEVSCDFDAITMDRHVLPVVDEDRCTACGRCIKRCSFQAFTFAEKNQAAKPQSRIIHFNQNLCRGCGVCSTGCPEKAIEMTGIECKQSLINEIIK